MITIFRTVNFDEIKRMSMFLTVYVAIFLEIKEYKFSSTLNYQSIMTNFNFSMFILVRYYFVQQWSINQHKINYFHANTSYWHENL